MSGLVLRPSDNKLLIGTHGNGMFETTVSGTLSVIDNPSSAAKFTLFPNPVLTEINIKFSNSHVNQKMKYEILDISGKRVLRGLTENNKVNVASLEHGIYIFSILINDENKFSKFIKK